MANHLTYSGLEKMAVGDTLECKHLGSMGTVTIVQLDNRKIGKISDAGAGFVDVIFQIRYDVRSIVFYANVFKIVYRMTFTMDNFSIIEAKG